MLNNLNIQKTIFILIALCFQNLSFGKQYSYDFYWFLVPVAKFKINSHQTIINSKKINFDIETSGPLKLYRNYNSSGFIEFDDSRNLWRYVLSGTDRGKPEVKSIIYSKDTFPIIEKFIDDKGVASLKIDQILDSGSIDPFSVLIGISKNINQNNNCNIDFSVMDGKRRYKLSVVEVNNTPKDRNKLENEKTLYNCKINFEYNSVSGQKKENKQWPFDGRSKNIDIWFSKGIGFMPLKITLNTPVGKITGRLRN